MIAPSTTATARAPRHVVGHRILAFYALGALVASTAVVYFPWSVGPRPFSAQDAWWLVVQALGSLGVARLMFVYRTKRLDVRTYRADWFAGVTLAFGVGTFLAVLVSGTGVAGRDLSLGYIVCLLWAYVGQWLAMRFEAPEAMLVPGGRIAEVASLPNIVCRTMATPEPVDGRVVVVDLHQRLAGTWIDFLAECQLRGVPVLHAGIVYERLTGRSSIRYLRDAVFEKIEPPRYAVLAKRVGEVLLITGLLPLVIPLMGITALAIRLESPGPVLFWQERVGLAGKPFLLVKFRSMRRGADLDGPKFASARDGRVTRVGRFIRKFRIDELPQLYNVLRGEMSLVGPRPEQVSFVAEFSSGIPFYAFRHNVRPGLTGWAQVRFGYAGTHAEALIKLEYDLYYVRNLSLLLDAHIVLLTIRTILTGFGSR